MELSRQEYPALLRSLPPNQAIGILEDRVRLIGKVNSDIGDWLSERRKAEEAYVQALTKLASRRPHEASEQLGIFQGPWQSIVSSVESLAQSHSLLATKIEVDVERPLKEYQTKNREMQAMTTIQSNLAAVAKEWDAAQKKTMKLSSGKSSANKVASATSDLDAANQLWDSQAPFVFEQLQALDESRVNHLRDVLTQFQTHEVDQVERNRATAENCLNALLSIDTKDEISTFVARNTSVAEAPVEPRLGSRGGRTSNATTTSAAPEPPSLRGTPSRPSIPPAETPSERPSPLAASTRSATEGAPGQKSGFGFRRLGTVLSRPNKSSKGMERAPSPDKRSRGSRNPLRRGQSSKQDMQAIPSPPRTPPSLPTQPPSSPPKTDMRNFGGTSIDRTDGFAASSSTSPANNPVNGDTIQQAPKRASTVPMTNGLHNGREPITSPEAESAPPKLANRDNDGFSVPSAAIDDITRAQQEAAAVGDTDQTGFKLNIQSQPIPEEDPDAQSAFSSVANTLRAQAQQAATPRKPSTNRGRRDVRNTIFVPSGQPIDSIGGSPTPIVPPFNIPSPSQPTVDPARGADAQSIRSAHSMSSVAHPSFTHPHMHQRGLNASIIETVSATFSRTQVTKAVVIGELALQHNPSDSLPSSGSEGVRLENFQVLEKVAPNPVFITQKPASSGEYSVNLADLSRPTVAFKYQVHLDDTNIATYAPISITPNWKIEPSQASVIVTYAFNPAFATVKRSVSLKNVVVLVSIENAKAQSCQSKPVGIFSKEKSLIYWKLGDINLDGNSTEVPAQKLLARFATTDGEAKVGGVEARWEIAGEHAAGLGSGLGLSVHGAAATDAASAAVAAEGTASNDPFADESTEKSTSAAAPSDGTWKSLPITRRIVSGRYNAS